MVQPDDFQSKLKSLPRGSFIFSLLVVGVLLALALWSLIAAPRLQVVAEGDDARTQLQTELRSLAGYDPLTNRSPVPVPASEEPEYLTLRDRLMVWKWPLMILLVGGSFAAWALVNFYLVHTEDLSDEDDEPVMRPPTVVTGTPAAAVRKVAEASPDWMRMAVQRSRDGLIVVDSAGKIHSANPAAEKLCGVEPGKLPGKRIADLIPELGATDADLRRFSQVTSATEVVLRKPDSAEPKTRLALHRVADSPQSLYLAVLSAVEAAPAAAPAPAASTAPAATGETPGRINKEALSALENQILMLNGYSEMMLSSLTKEDPGYEDVEGITRAAARATLLCHEVAADSQPHPRRLDLNEFPVAIASRLATLLDSGVPVKGLRGASATEVWTDPNLLEHALASIAWRAQEWAGGLEAVVVSASNGRLELRMTPKGKLTPAASRAAFDALPAIDWIEKLSGTIEMAEHSDTAIRFRIWLPAAAQARTPQNAGAAGRHGRRAGEAAADD
ncbi:MAG: PAS domain S-box protein [Bryobacterales bacterium]|nr:PAS domain S-box protein [Bryobacterales bacterium]